MGIYISVLYMSSDNLTWEVMRLDLTVRLTNKPIRMH